MKKEEKLLLIELLMTDIRMYWGRTWYGADRTKERRKKIIALCVQVFNEEPATWYGHYLLTIIGRLTTFTKDTDGRYLRAPLKYGGYEGIEQLHDIPSAAIKYPNGMVDTKYYFEARSLDFKVAALGYLQCPMEYYFVEFMNESDKSIKKLLIEND